MKKLFFQTLLISLVNITSCSSFKQVLPEINEHDLSPNCEGLISLIKKNWKKHKELEYHEYNQELLGKLQNDYRDCILTLKSEQVIQIFGMPPKDWGDSHIAYYLKEGCIGFPDDCEILIFAIKNNQVKSVYVKIHEAEIEK